MKRTFIAFYFLLSLLCLRGAPFFAIKYGAKTHKLNSIIVRGYPDNCIDRFDTCQNLSPWLYIAYSMNGKIYAFVLGRDKSIFKPKNYESFTKGEYHFLCKAKIEKKYIDELPEGINFSHEDQSFYDNRPQGFKLIKVCHIKTKNFCLTVNLVEQTIQFKSAGIKEEGKLTCFYYL